MIDKKKRINSWFIIIYSLGVLLLVIDGFSNDLIDLGIANLVSLLVALLVLIKVSKG